MGEICRGYNHAYFTAVDAFLRENGISVLVQDVPNYYTGGSLILTVANADHDRALRLLKEAGLDPAETDLSGG